MRIAMQLCDDDGIVRTGATGYPCTGSAHIDGVHVQCGNRVHEQVGVYVPHERPDWQASATRTVAARVVKL